LHQISRRLTFANVVACIALFVALGGVGYAATQLPKNSVGTRQLKNGAVTAAKIDAATRKALGASTGPGSGAVGPAGPKGDTGAAGQTGPQGAPGEPGTPGASPALGYIHLAKPYELQVTAQKGVAGVHLGESTGGAPAEGIICLDLEFTPTIGLVSPEGIVASSSTSPSYLTVRIPASEPRASHSGCPVDYRDASIEYGYEGVGSGVGLFAVFY
jgi:hypothetical protein